MVLGKVNRSCGLRRILGLRKVVNSMLVWRNIGIRKKVGYISASAGLGVVPGVEGWDRSRGILRSNS